MKPSREEVERWLEDARAEAFAKGAHGGIARSRDVRILTVLLRAMDVVEALSGEHRRVGMFHEWSDKTWPLPKENQPLALEVAWREAEEALRRYEEGSDEV